MNQMFDENMPFKVIIYSIENIPFVLVSENIELNSTCMLNLYKIVIYGNLLCKHVMFFCC